MSPLELSRKLKDRFADLVSDPIEFRGEVSVTIASAAKISDVCAFAKHELGCDILLDITSIDNYGQDPRWTIVYELYGLSHRRHLRLKTHVTEEQSELPSVTPVWPTANWHEREIYDMMGIRFRDHPDLRRILMWEGFDGHPLRKDWQEPFCEEDFKPLKSRWPGGEYVSSEDKNAYKDNLRFPPNFEGFPPS